MNSYKEIIDIRIDSNNLNRGDFFLSGNLRIDKGHFGSFTLKAMFKKDNENNYSPIEEFFDDNLLDKPYGLFIQDENKTFMLGSGYLHKSDEGEIFTGVKHSTFPDNENSYINTRPLFMHLVNNEGNLIVDQNNPVELFFLQKDPHKNSVDLESRSVKI